MSNFDIGFQNHIAPQAPQRTGEPASATPSTTEHVAGTTPNTPRAINPRDVGRRFTAAQTTPADVDHALQNLVSKFITTPLPVNPQGRLTMEDMEAFMKSAMAELEHSGSTAVSAKPKRTPEEILRANLQAPTELRSSQVTVPTTTRTGGAPPLSAGSSGSQPNLLADIMKSRNPLI